MPDGSALFVSSIDGYVSILSTKDVGAPMPTDDKCVRGGCSMGSGCRHTTHTVSPST